MRWTIVIMRKTIYIPAAGLAALLVLMAALLAAGLSAPGAVAHAPAQADDELAVILEKSVGGVYETLAANDTFALREGEEFEYRMKLNRAPAGEVTVRLMPTLKGADPGTGMGKLAVTPDTLTFQPGDAETFQEVTVTAVPDRGYQDEQVYIIHEVSGGDFGGVWVAPIFFRVVESKPSPEFSHTALEMREDDTTEYTVKLLSDPGSDITMDVQPAQRLAASPPFLTFTPDDWGSPHPVQVVHDAATGEPGGYVEHNFAQSRASVRARVWPNTQGIALSAENFSVQRGGVIVYTAALAAWHGGKVVIRITDAGGCGITFSPERLEFESHNWNEQQAVTANVSKTAAPGDCQISHTADSGSSQGDVTPFEATATITVTAGGPDELPGVELTGIPPTFSPLEGTGFIYRLDVNPGEGPSATVTFRSDNSDVSLSRTENVFNSDASFAVNTTVTAEQEPDAVDGPFNISHSVKGNNIAIVSAVVVDDDRMGISASPSAVRVVEGSEVGYGLRLSAQPRENMFVAIRAPLGQDVINVNGDCGVGDPGPLLTFTPDNWDSTQTVRVAACDDLAEDDHEREINLIGSNDPSCTSQDSCRRPGVRFLEGNVWVEVIDDDTSGLTLSASALLLVNEGESNSYTVKMDYPPGEEVTVSISGSSDEVQISPQSLTFTPDDWSAPQLVTVTAPEDVDYFDEEVTLTHGTSFSDIVSLLTVKVEDNDQRPAFVFGGCNRLDIGNECYLSNVPEGGSREYTIGLDRPPLEDIAVSISSDALAFVTPSPTELTFTPDDWAARTVRVTVGPGSPGTATLTHNATGSGFTSGERIGRVIVMRDARPGFYFPRCAPPPVFTDVAECSISNIPQGQSGSYGMRLRRRPANDVDVTVTHGGDSHVDLKQTADGEPSDSLMFTFTRDNWDQEQFAYFTAHDTGDPGEVADTLLHSANGAGYGNQAVGRFTIGVVDRDRAPPMAVAVRDGLHPMEDADFNDGSLTTLSANWTFDDTAIEYLYAVGTTCGGMEIAEWTTDWQTGTSVTLTGLSLHTGQTYYFSVRARDANGNESIVSGGDSCAADGPSSDGQAVLPLLDVSVSPTLIEAGRISEDPERTITLTIVTNAHHGFRALMYRTESDLPDFTGGTYDNPAAWTTLADGLAFSVGDCDVNGGKFWSMPNCGGERRFAPITRNSPGNVIADHTALVDGATGPVRQSYEILLRAPTSGGQSGDGAITVLIIQVVAGY